MSTDALEFMESLDGPLTLGGALSALRETEEESLTSFAKRLGISPQHLCDVEQGRRAVSPERAARFAKILGHSERLFVKLALEDLLRSQGLAYSLTLEPLRKSRKAS